MWVKKSSISLSASAVSALYAKNYTTACIFFIMGVFERMEENEEKIMRKHEEKEKDYMTRYIRDLQKTEQNVLGRLGEHSSNIFDLKKTINLLRENL